MSAIPKLKHPVFISQQTIEVNTKEVETLNNKEK